jgi:hypothetical protein
MPSAAPQETENRRAIDASNARWRGRFLALAFVLPTLLAGLFARQQRRLDELLASGRATVATVTRISAEDDVHYRYLVAGKTFTWSVRGRELPNEIEVGAPLTVTYLPSDPGFSRAGFPFTEERREAERNPGITWGFPLGLAAFFFGAAALCHRALRGSQRGSSLDATPKRTRSPEEQMALVLRFVTPLVLVVLVASTQLAESLEVFRKLWGDAPLGLPLRLAVAVGVSVLYAPFFFVARHAAPFLRPGDDEVDVLVHLVKAPSHHRRSRLVMVAAICYLLALLAGWIAYTSFRGV